MAEITRNLTETEEQIIAYQEMGRPRAIRNLIATNNKALIIWALNNTGYSRDDRRDREEMEQEAFILLLEAIDEYDHTRGAFSTLYRLKVLSMDRKSELYNQDKSLNDLIGEEEDVELGEIIEDEEAGGPFIDLEEEDENRQIREEVKGTLGEELANLVFASYGIEQEEKTYKEIAEKYDVSIYYVQEQINNAKYRLKSNGRLKAIYKDGLK